MKRFLSHISLLVVLAGFIPNVALASDCYVDPVQQYSGSGTIKSAVFMRSEACVTGTMVLRTLSTGTRVDVVGYTDGWYEVISGGKRGWIGQQFLENGAHVTGLTWPDYVDYRTNATASSVTSDIVVAPMTEEAYAGVIGSHDLIKLVCPSTAGADHSCRAVYYVGADGKRHAFPNSRVYFTWYSNFDTVKAVSAERLGQYMLGANITYRPGARMVKFTTDPKVYAVGRGGVLRWVKTEELAIALYGATWNQKIDDIADAFYANYTFGLDISLETDFNPTVELNSTPTFD